MAAERSRELIVSIVFGFLTVIASSLTLLVGLTQKEGADVVYSTAFFPSLDANSVFNANSVEFEHFCDLIRQLEASSEGRGGGDSMVRVYVKNVGENQATEVVTKVKVPGTIVGVPSENLIDEACVEITSTNVTDQERKIVVHYSYNREPHGQEAPTVSVRFQEGTRNAEDARRVKDVHNTLRTRPMNPLILPGTLLFFGSIATAWLLRRPRQIAQSVD